MEDFETVSGTIDAVISSPSALRLSRASLGELAAPDRRTRRCAGRTTRAYLVLEKAPSMLQRESAVCGSGLIGAASSISITRTGPWVEIKAKSAFEIR